jgi:hypothetical protein|eukprot:COSAG01_NODE_6126_length_3837_cov_720.067416_4_plen_376_part_00
MGRKHAPRQQGCSSDPLCDARIAHAVEVAQQRHAQHIAAMEQEHARKEEALLQALSEAQLAVSAAELAARPAAGSQPIEHRAPSRRRLLLPDHPAGRLQPSRVPFWLDDGSGETHFLAAMREKTEKRRTVGTCDAPFGNGAAAAAATAAQARRALYTTSSGGEAGAMGLHHGPPSPASHHRPREPPVPRWLDDGTDSSDFVAALHERKSRQMEAERAWRAAVNQRAMEATVEAPQQQAGYPDGPNQEAEHETQIPEPRPEGENCHVGCADTGMNSAHVLHTFPEDPDTQHGSDTAPQSSDANCTWDEEGELGGVQDQSQSTRAAVYFDEPPQHADRGEPCEKSRRIQHPQKCWDGTRHRPLHEWPPSRYVCAGVD